MSLAAVWVVAGVVIGLVRTQRMTAGRTIEYVTMHPLNGLADAERQPIIAEVADRVNRLSFDERQRLRHRHELRPWLEQLTDAEQQQYIERTLPKGVKHTLTSFNGMTRAKRKQIVNRALIDMERLRGEVENTDAILLLSDEAVKRVIEEGLNSFYNDASDETRLDLQPLVEQIQHIMQMGR